MKTDSKYLMSESPMLVYPTLAMVLGLNESIVLQQIKYWLNTSKHHYDGRPWIYNTLDEWAEQFIWCDKRTVQRAIDSLRDKDILLTGNYNKRKADRTLWYSIDYEQLDHYMATHLDKMSISITTKCLNEIDKMSSALPENNTENTTKSIEADACNGSASPTPSPTLTENFLFPLQEERLVTKRVTKKTPTPPIASAPPSPKRNPAAAALSAKNRELLKEFEPKARPIWAAIEKQINALANGDNPMTPEEYEYVFRALKRDPWWANKPLTPSIVGKQAGAILPHVENQVTMELNYAW